MSKVEYLADIADSLFRRKMRSELLRTIRQEEQDYDLFCDCCGKESPRLFVINTIGVLENMNMCLECFLKEVDRGEI